MKKIIGVLIIFITVLSEVYVLNKPFRIEAKIKASDTKRDLTECYDKLKEMAKNGRVEIVEKNETQKEYIKFGKWNHILSVKGYSNDYNDWILDYSENKEDIEWEVLEYSEDKKRALVISRYILDYKQYHKEAKVDVTWENSFIRKWLNGTFYKNAFSVEERKLINKTLVNNKEANSELYYQREKYGNNTKDRIFLLSLSDVIKYFGSKDTYLYDNINDNINDSNLERCATLKSGKPREWLLRGVHYWKSTEGHTLASFVFDEGAISCGGMGFFVYPIDRGFGIRPAMWIDLTQEIIDANRLSVGGYNNINKKIDVVMGRYQYSDSRGNKSETKTKIEWEVIDYDKKNNRALLISKYKLCDMPYDTGMTPVTWVDCSLRKWLNSDFYKTSFNKNERKLIYRVKNKNKHSKDSHTVKNGKDTKDKIFLLSESDIINLYGYNGNMTYDLKCTYIDGLTGNWDDTAIPRWWLRTHTDYNYENLPQVELIDNGSIDADNYYYDDPSESGVVSYGVRPAMWISLK